MPCIKITFDCSIVKTLKPLRCHMDSGRQHWTNRPTSTFLQGFFSCHTTPSHSPLPTAHPTSCFPPKATQRAQEEAAALTWVSLGSMGKSQKGVKETQQEQRAGKGDAGLQGRWERKDTTEEKSWGTWKGCWDCPRGGEHKRLVRTPLLMQQLLLSFNIQCYFIAAGYPWLFLCFGM